MNEEARLERIENKLDQMSDAIVALARMEERVITMFRRLDTLDSEQSKHNRRIQLVENRVGANAQGLRFAERAFWVIATAAVGYLFMMIK